MWLDGEIWLTVKQALYGRGDDWDGLFPDVRLSDVPKVFPNRKRFVTRAGFRIDLVKESDVMKVYRQRNLNKRPQLTACVA